MRSSDGEKDAREWSNMAPHDEFLELCALSTSGDLTENEQNRLKAHLAGCAECRQALKDFEAAVDVGVPLLASKLSPVPSEAPVSPQADSSGETVAFEGMASASRETQTPILAGGGKRGFVFAGRNGHERRQINWNYVWMPLAACVLLTISLGIYAYRVGKSSSSQSAHANISSVDDRVEALEQRISDAGHEREMLRAQIAERDKVIAELHVETERQAKTLDEMKSAQLSLEQSLQNDDAEKQRVADDRASLAQKFEVAQASLQRMQSELEATNTQRAQEQAQDASLQSQIADLSGQLREQNETVAKQDELLAHDRDIRELMGARDLYVAEVYDVGRDGATQKAYGRVFYTKGKSLIFYAYDLDEAPGVRNASTFQAWGRRGPDREQALDLGIFYVDNAAKKRWVLKFDNPKELDEIDAVFVTVEPKGGSRKPSGKPLLYAYLQLAPNHP
jgi:Anti-sigma-K factor rskA, C-terminal/Putative zinc-finger